MPPTLTYSFLFGFVGSSASIASQSLSPKNVSEEYEQISLGHFSFTGVF
jgi:hypothetical protein